MSKNTNSPDSKKRKRLEIESIVDSGSEAIKTKINVKNSKYYTAESLELVNFWLKNPNEPDSMWARIEIKSKIDNFAREFLNEEHELIGENQSVDQNKDDSDTKTYNQAISLIMESILKKENKHTIKNNLFISAGKAEIEGDENFDRIAAFIADNMFGDKEVPILNESLSHHYNGSSEVLPRSNKKRGPRNSAEKLRSEKTKSVEDENFDRIATLIADNMFGDKEVPILNESLSHHYNGSSEVLPRSNMKRGPRNSTKKQR